MKQKPLISIIIPCYNQAHFLPEALQSLVEQTCPDWEGIIVNDGSTDNTEQVAKEWARRDNRFRYISKKHGGLSSARNAGLALAAGDFLQFLDADDRLHPEKFAISLEQPNYPDIILTDFLLFTGTGEPFISSAFQLRDVSINFCNILLGWDDLFVIPIHCGLLKRSLFETIRFQETLKAKEDWLMWLQLYQRPVKTVIVNKPYAWYRRSLQNMSQNRKHMHANLVLAYQEIFKILPPEFREAFFTKAVNTLGRELEEADVLFEKTRRSKSYRIGNLLVRNVKRIINR